MYLKEGYFIDNEETKTECLFRYNSFNNNPNSFEYKTQKDSLLVTKNIDDVAEYKIYNTEKYYKRYILKENVFDAELKLIRKAGEKVFLTVLLESDASLYVLEDKTDIFFFDDGSGIQILNYSEIIEGKQIEGRKFQKQLYNNIYCKGFTIKKYSKIKYDKDDLINFFEEFADCSGNTAVNFYKKRTKTKIDFKFNLGAIYNLKPSLNFNQDTNFTLDDTDDLESFLSYNLGFEAEFTFTNDLDKWRLYVAPNIQKIDKKFTVKTKFNIPQYPVSPPIYESNVSIELLNLELPIGIRRYFDINKNFELFVGTAFAFNLSVDEEFSSRPVITNVLSDNNTRHSIMLNLGTTYKEKFGIALNYYVANNKMINEYVGLNSFGSIGFVASYKLF